MRLNFTLDSFSQAKARKFQPLPSFPFSGSLKSTEVDHRKAKSTVVIFHVLRELRLFGTVPLLINLKVICVGKLPLNYVSYKPQDLCRGSPFSPTGMRSTICLNS